MNRKYLKILTAVMLMTGTSAFAATDTIGDDFSNGNSYNTSTGSLHWVGPWVEFSDSNSLPFSDPTTNAMQINNDKLQFGNSNFFSSLSIKANHSIVRALDLEGKTNIVLTFDFTRNADFDNSSEILDVQLWDHANSAWLVMGQLTLDGTYSTTITNGNLTTKDAKIRFLSGSGDWASDPKATIDNVLFSFDYKDTDGDGVGDLTDLDDDNDGILDTVEFAATAEKKDITTTWVSNTNDQATGKIGSLGVVIDDNGAMDAFGSPPMAAFNPTDSSFWSSDTRDTLQAHAALFMVRRNDGTIKITLPKATKRVLIHVDRLGSHSSGTSTSATFILLNATDFQMTMGDSNGNLNVNETTKVFERILGVTGQTQRDSSPGANGPTDGSSAGTIIIQNNTAFTDLEFGVTGALDGVYMIIESLTDDTGDKDSDNDGISDHFDLDSDNDGIPDTIEAQSTELPNPPVYIAGGTNVDGNGIPNEVSPNGLTPIDTDNDGIDDFLDKDSDDDDISDCKEGNIATMEDCPITTVLADGMSSDAGSDGNYGNIYGNVADVKVNLFSYIAVIHEVAYRFARVCGNDPWPLKSNQWKTISVPCKVDNSILDIFDDLLGTNYGDNGDWVMYEQQTDYSGTSAANVMMSSGDLMVPGKGYWIITSKPDVTVHVSESSNTVHKTTRQLPIGHSVTSPSFTEVHTYGMPASTAEVQKVLLGNPFPGPIHLGNVFLSNNGGTNYFPMYDNTNILPFAKQTVYVYDAVGTDPINYVAKTPAGTPGFGDTIDAGIGFWLRLEATGSGANKIDYPFEN